MTREKISIKNCFYEDEGKMVLTKIGLDKLEKECIGYLKEYCYTGDTKCDHINADDMIMSLVKALGFKKLEKEYYKIDKWYA